MDSRSYEKINHQEINQKKIISIYQNKILCFDTNPSLADILFYLQSNEVFKSVGQAKKIVWDRTKVCTHSGVHEWECFDQVLVVLDPYGTQTLNEYETLLNLVETQALNAVITLIEINDEYNKHSRRISCEQTRHLSQYHQYHHKNIWKNWEGSYESRWIESIHYHIGNIASKQTDNKRNHLMQIIDDTKYSLYTDISTNEQKNAIETITSHLKIAISRESTYDHFDINLYFEENQQELLNALKTLQSTSNFHINSMINIITTTFAFLSVACLPLLWIAEILKNNYEKTEYSLTFDANGQ